MVPSQNRLPKWQGTITNPSHPSNLSTIMLCPLVLTLLQLRSTAFITPASSHYRPAVNTYDYYFTLSSLRRNNEDDYYVEDDGDGDDDDEDPPEFSMSPQEFLNKLQSNSNGNNNEIPAAMPSFTSKSKPRPTPRIRQQILGSSKSKESTMFVCSKCDAQYLQWRGRCGTCQEWNTIQQVAVKKRSTFVSGDAPSSTGMGMHSNRIRPTKKQSSWLDGVTSSGELDNGQGPVRLTDVYEEENTIISNSEQYNHYRGRPKERLQIPHDQEMNSVLGGGIMPGSITLLGGDPGVGKVCHLFALTLTNQFTCNLTDHCSPHYFFKWLGKWRLWQNARLNFV